MQTAVSLVISALLILSPFSFAAAFVLALIALFEKDPIRKKPFKKAALYCLVIPALILVVVLAVWGLANAIAHSGE